MNPAVTELVEQPGYNVISLARGQRQAQRVTIDNPPAGGIAAWSDDLQIQAWDDVEAEPVLNSVEGFTVTDSAGTFEWLPDAADTSELEAKVYTYKIRRISDGTPISFGPFIVRP